MRRLARSVCATGAMLLVVGAAAGGTGAAAEQRRSTSSSRRSATSTPRDAILAAASYLRRSRAAEDLDRALFAHNDSQAFFVYYAWRVYVRTLHGSRRLIGPGLD
jgi:hypothetical protein